MERRFQDPAWWNEQVKQHGCTPRSSDYSQKSHEVRLQAIVEAIRRYVPVLGQCHLLDLPCGVGLLNQALGAIPKGYTGGDFSSEALKLCITTARAWDTKPVCYEVDVRESNWPEMLRPRGPYDAIVSCGLFCFEEIFQEPHAAIAFIEQALNLGEPGAVLVANFAWQGMKPCYCPGIQCYEMDTLVTQCRVRSIACSIEYGYLPHEFIGVFHL